MAARNIEVSAVQAVIDEYQRSVNAGDAAAYGALCLDDAIRMPPGAPDDFGRDSSRGG